MKVYGLVGKSGTGKSYQAMNLCKELNIESIIDDGLFIYGSSILEGTSAKRQNTKVAAIKTALFTDEEHRRAVMEKIREVSPGSILVLGTSEKMISRIAEHLDLSELEKIIISRKLPRKKNERRPGSSAMRWENTLFRFPHSS
jgi:adenylate kinase family enzyme